MGWAGGGQVNPDPLTLTGLAQANERALQRRSSFMWRQIGNLDNILPARAAPGPMQDDVLGGRIKEFQIG
jgi:hypothetical protein